MKKFVIGGAVLVLLVLLLSWGKLFGGKALTFWGETQVACLPSGHTNLALHIHQNLKIFVDGTEEVVPANIGISPSCMSEIHTHDVTGQIHIEAADASKTFTLTDFFAVWDKPFERSGYTVAATVNGEPNDDPGKFPLKDTMQIVLTYTSAATSTAQ